MDPREILEQATEVAVDLRRERSTKSGAIMRVAAQYGVDFDALNMAVQNTEKMEKRAKARQARDSKLLRQVAQKPQRWTRYPDDIKARAINLALALRAYPDKRPFAIDVAADEYGVEPLVLKRWVDDDDVLAIRQSKARRGPRPDGDFIEERQMASLDDALDAVREAHSKGLGIELRNALHTEQLGPKVVRVRYWIATTYSTV